MKTTPGINADQLKLIRETKKKQLFSIQMLECITCDKEYFIRGSIKVSKVECSKCGSPFYKTIAIFRFLRPEETKNTIEDYAFSEN